MSSFDEQVAFLSQRTGATYKPLANGEYQGACPACEPHGRGHHLYLRPGTKSPVVFFCQHGCTWDAIRAAGGLDQWREEQRATMSAAPDFTYEYRDGQGNLQLQVLRWGRGPGKRVQQRRPNGNGWEYQLNGFTPGLFRAEKLAKAPAGALCCLVEGEPDVLRLEKEGQLATTSIRGTSGWKAAYAADLQRFKVAIFPDHDEPGVKLARQRLSDCHAAGITAAIVWLDFPITKDHGADVSDWLQDHDGKDLEGRIALAFQGLLIDPALPPPRFHLMTLDELYATPSPVWAMPDLFEEREMVVCYGLYSTGKSFFTSDVLLHAACGRVWLGRQPKEQRVVYVNADGGQGFKKRLQAWERVNGTVPRENFLVMNQPVNLMDPEQVGDLIRQLDGKGYTIVAFDTLSQCIAGADEVSTKDMGLVTSSLQRVQERLDCGTWTCHHATKDGKSPRGNMTLCNKAATVIATSRPEEYGPIMVHCDKQRNFERFKSLFFELTKVDDSCVLTTREKYPSFAAKLQLMPLILDEPGLTAAQLMERLAIGQTALYDEIRRLAAAGQVEVMTLPGEWEGRPPRGVFPTCQAMREAKL